MEPEKVNFDDKETIDITLSGVDIVNVLNAISTLPYNVAKPLLEKIERQIIEKKSSKPS